MAKKYKNRKFKKKTVIDLGTKCVRHLKAIKLIFTVKFDVFIKVHV